MGKYGPENSEYGHFTLSDYFKTLDSRDKNLDPKFLLVERGDETMDLNVLKRISKGKKPNRSL